MKTRSLDRAQHRIVLELQNRVGMLCVHGGILLTIGLMMLITGGPAPAAYWFGSSARLTLGGFATLVGFTILVGTARGDNDRWGWPLMVVGTFGAILWHLALAAVYAYAASVERLMVLSPSELLAPDITSRGYIPLVYFGYLLLVTIHSVTLVRLGPPPRS